MTHTTQERRSVTALAAIFAFRMLGLFMILPVFSTYADDLIGANRFLIGVAIGSYGLTQACLQIPFGFLSDCFGRKPIIALGLCLFALGSMVAAMSHSIYMMIIGRALQGTGAIGSTLIAFVADVTKEQNRTKAMAVVGLVIGTSFSVAMVLGIFLSSHIGLSGIFWVTAGLALIGLVILFTAVPTPPRTTLHRDSEAVPALFRSVLTNMDLLRLDFGIFCQHAILTATFIVVPIALEKYIGMGSQQQWYLYLPILIVSFLAMVPLIIVAEKRRKMKPIFLLAIACIGIAQVLLAFLHSYLWEFALSLCLFFTAFNLLEASLPSLISKIAPAGSKGTAMGVYSSSQFLGIFLGGASGGYLYQHYHLMGVFFGCASLALLWFAVSFFMNPTPYLSTLLLPVNVNDEAQAQQLAQQLRAQPGVNDVAIAIEEGVAYLKIDKASTSEQSLLEYLKTLKY